MVLLKQTKKQNVISVSDEYNMKAFITKREHKVTLMFMKCQNPNKYIVNH